MRNGGNAARDGPGILAASPRDICYGAAMVPDAVNPGSIRRALVVKLRHHGDVLLASPVFRVLANRAPHAEIDALVYDETRDMLTGHPNIAQVHGIGRQWRHAGLAEQARRESAL